MSTSFSPCRQLQCTSVSWCSFMWLIKYMQILTSYSHSCESSMWLQQWTSSPVQMTINCLPYFFLLLGDLRAQLERAGHFKHHFCSPHSLIMTLTCTWISMAWFGVSKMHSVLAWTRCRKVFNWMWFLKYWY